MSSLAGALDQPVRHTYDYTSTHSTHDLDVDMHPPTNDDEGVFEQSFKDESGATHIAAADEGMEDLFGHDAEIEEAKPEGREFKSESAPTTTPAESGYDSDELSQEEKERRKALEYLEPDEPGGVAPPQEANVSIPNIPIPRTSDGDHWVIRMPNFVNVDSKPFHPDTYVGPEQDEEEIHQNESVREKSMTIKLKVENTVRWRWIKDEYGQDKRQSNSRVIRWSDGTLSLLLGKELFDINQTIDTSGGIVRQSLGGSQPQASQNTPTASQHPPSVTKSQGLTYLVAQHKRAEVLQAEAVITGYMSLRPTGMQSETHRMLVRAVGQKHNKVARLRMAPDPTMDPEREKQELIKLSAKKSRKKAEDVGFGTRRKRTGYTRKRAGHDVWSDDEEPEYEGSGDEDDTGGPHSAKRKTERDRKGPGEYQEDDFVVADESDEDFDHNEGGKSGKKRRRRDEEEDPLDRLDAKISQQEQDERRRKLEDSAQLGEDDQEMDVESEEDEEEHKIRRVGSGVRKKRAVTFGEEEEE